MGFVKGNAFQRYGYLRVSGHDFTPKMLGLPLQTHKLTSKKKNRDKNFQVDGFKSFFTLHEEMIPFDSLFFQMG